MKTEGTPLKIKSLLVLITSLSLIVAIGGCGTTNTLQSITITPGANATPPTSGTGAGSNFVNMQGIGATQQFTVSALYSNGKSVAVTTQATYTLTAPTLPPDAINKNVTFGPASALTINASGMAEVVGGACTWYDDPGPIIPPSTTPGPMFFPLNLIR